MNEYDLSTVGDLYDAIFDPEVCVQFRTAIVDETGSAGWPHKFGNWVSVDKEDPVTAFLGHFLVSATSLIDTDNIRIIPAESHDGKIVPIQGKKYLLTEVKDI